MREMVRAVWRRLAAVPVLAVLTVPVMLSLLGGARAGTHVAAGTGTAAGGTWGTAQKIAGNSGGNATVNSVSCASAGNCSAGGYIRKLSDGFQAFVVNETSGTWGTAIVVAVKLNAFGDAEVTSVSCASVGNCGAGGSYTDASGHRQAFVVGERNGTWGRAKEVAAGLNVGGGAEVDVVSCASAGNCGAGGSYAPRGGGGALAFVVSETNGTWGAARQVAAALDKGRGSGITSVSCPSAGNCSAAGSFKPNALVFAPFVVDERNGTWGRAKRVAASVSNGGNAGISSVSCVSAGNCSAGGGSGGGAFVISERNGTWGKAEDLPGGGNAGISSVSCTSVGNCGAGGTARRKSGVQPFVVNEVHGTWGKVQEVPGIQSLNLGGDSTITSVSCASPGNCGGGEYFDGNPGNQQAFVVNEVNGTWRKAEEVPGTAALNGGGEAIINSVSCASAGKCSAGGQYTDSSGGHQAFVVNET